MLFTGCGDLSQGSTAGSIIAARSSDRYTADSEGTGATLRLASSNTSRRGPPYGRERRNSTTAASTCGDI
jgi:hypothetical protein